MKLKLHRISLFLMSLLPAAMFAQQAQEPIRLTFGGVGESKQVESVRVDNLTQGTTLTIGGNDILILSGEATGIEDVEGGAVALTRPLIYPNPAQTDAKLIFDAPKAGKVSIKIYNTGGALVDAADINVAAGRNAVRIPTQGYGFFIVRVDGVGIHYSEKWMSGAPKNGSRIEHVGMSTRELPTAAPLATRTTTFDAAQQSSKEMQFKAGDLLRFTATTGNMKTIVMQCPEQDHTITFQFYKCEDADGYNYPIIEVGGLLWMAEDLRFVDKVKLAKMQSASEWADPDANPVRMAYADFQEGNNKMGGFYTPKAAMKALPEGWKLPTGDELIMVNKALGGAEIAGKLLKAHGSESTWATTNEEVDAVQLNLKANGYLTADGRFKGRRNAAYVLTRSFKNGAPCVMRLSDGIDKAELSLDVVAAVGEGYTVRGVRPAVSSYNGFISEWYSENPDMATKKMNVMSLSSGLEGNPFAYTAPLGQHYSMTSGAEYYATNFEVFATDNSNGMKAVASQKKLSSSDKLIRTLHHSVAQSRPNGLQRLINVSWSKPCVNDVTEDNKQEDISMIGPGTIKIEVYGDDTEKDFYYTGDLDYDFKLLAPKYMGGMDKVNWYSQMMYDRPLHNILEQYMASLQTLCADFNGDGVDDLLIGLCGKMIIVDGTDYKTLLVKKDFPKASSEYSSVSFAAGDINKDGVVDLAAIYEKNGNYYMEAWWNGYENFNAVSNAQKSLGKARLCHGLTINDWNEDGNADVICQTFDLNKHDIFMMSYNEKANRLDDFTSGSFENERTALNNSDMYLYRAYGLLKSQVLFCNGTFFDFDKKGGQIIRVNSISEKMDVHYGCTAVGDYIGQEDGLQTLIMEYYIYKPWEKEEEYEIPIGIALCEYFYSDDEEGDNYDSDQEGNKFKYNNFKTWCRGKGVNTELSYIMKFGYALSSHKTNIEYPFTSFCNIRYKHPLREVELSSIETTMTEPRIYALLAAAPYWEAYKDNYADAPGTSWGYENTKGQGETRSSSHTAIFIAGYEQEFNLPLVGTQVGGVDFELNIKNTWTDSEEKSVQTTYGVDYTTFYEDAVVLTLTPYTAYYYTIVKSGNEEELGNTLMIGVPDEPRNMILSMNDYMKLRADDPSIPNLKKLFRHTVGNPWSYKKEYVDAMPVKDKNSIMWGEGEWSKWQNVGSVGAISRTISVTEEQVKTKETEFELETTLVSNTFGIKAGGGYGFNHKNAVSHMESVGHTVSATVVAPKTLEDASAKNFKWNFCRANVVFQGQNFPVVTYIVKQ